MKLLATLALAAVTTFGVATAQVTNGDKAPAFSVTSTSGDVISNDTLAGKTVVLEWTNHECPFVKKHYGPGNMQMTQKEATKDGVVWVSVVSSAPGKQGHINAEKAASLTKDRDAAPSYIVLDESGDLGKMFAAKTTPHMFILDDEGVVKYQGAIDSNRSANPASIDGATNYVLAALGNMKAGEAIETAQSKPYGCSVKY